MTLLPNRTRRGYLTLTHRLQLSKEQELGLTQNRKKFDIREEYFVRPLRHLSLEPYCLSGPHIETQRSGGEGVGTQAH